MPSRNVVEATIEEWRDLGFFYDIDHRKKKWRIVGSTSGVKRFADAIKAYASDPSNAMPSEHEHLGPYMYLEIGTWHIPEINDHWIAGPIPNLLALARKIEGAVQHSSIGECLSLRGEFSPEAPYDLVLEIREDSFDPPTEDKACR